jgi:metal-responsive CopG/Arc/MetJ family transcriptional regulator
MPKGGKREGAGNKPNVPGKPNSNHVGIRISDELLQRMDATRGSKTRPDWIRDAIEEKIKKDTTT